MRSNFGSLRYPSYAPGQDEDAKDDDLKKKILVFSVRL